MTGFKSKKAAALDEDGMYLVHQTDHSENNLNMVAQPAQEPVAFYSPKKGFYWAKPTKVIAPTIVDVPPMSLYTAPPQRKWIDLTPQDLNAIFAIAMTGEHAVHLASDKLKEKNNG